MARITYSLFPFEGTKASAGALCVMTKDNYLSDTISNVDELGAATVGFKGAGICRFQSPSNFLFTVNSITYTFSLTGQGTSMNAKGYQLKLATVQGSIIVAGSVIATTTNAVTTRGDSGYSDTSIVYTTADNVSIQTLNARDQFAVNALRVMMSNISNPSALSNNEMSFYCEAAYQWAANMMNAAANARTRDDIDARQTAGTTTPEDLPKLDSNTEKLLNNIIVAIEALTTSVTALKTQLHSDLTDQITAINGVADAISGN